MQCKQHKAIEQHSFMVIEDLAENFQENLRRLNTLTLQDSQ